MTKTDKYYFPILLISLVLVVTCDPPTEADTTGNIQGVIYNVDPFGPLSGATITTSPTTSSKISDNSGAYSIEGVEPGNYTVQVVKTGFETNYTNIQVIAGETSTADIQLTPLGPHLTVSLNDLNFGTSTTSLSFSIENDGIGTLTYSITHSENWITVSPINGSVTDETDVVYVNVDRSGKPFGNYFGTLNISSNTNNEVMNVIMVVPNPDQPQLSGYPPSLNFETSISELSVWISNTGTGILSWNIIDNMPWISINPQSGTTENETDEVLISIDRINQQPGNYAGLITINSDGGNQLITVDMAVSSDPTLSISPQTLDFSDSISSLTFNVNNVGDGDLIWSISDNQEWITTSPSSGVNNGTINVQVDRSILSEGSYSGTVTVSSNGGESMVEVLMIVPGDEPPSEITLLDPSDITETSMILNWTRNFDADFAAYYVYRDLTPAVTQNSTLIATIVNSSENYYTDTGLSSATTYYYRVYVMDLANQITYSNVVDGTTLIQLGNWSLVATLGTHLFGIDVLNENFAVAVGSSGSVFYYNGIEWNEETIPTNSTLHGVTIITQSDIWAVGNDGTVIHFNGVNWELIDSAPIESYHDCSVITQSSDQTVWIGCYTNILQYDNGNWSEYSLNGEDITDIHFNDSGEGWATDYRGKIYYYNGFGWSLQHNLEYAYHNGTGVNAIWADSPSNIWLGTGYTGNQIMHWNGIDWQTIDIPDENADYISDISGSTNSDLWFTDDFPYDNRYSGDIFHWDGNILQRVNSPVTEPLWDLKMTSPLDGWAVGYGGIILRYH